jgi:hypothetical protein
MNHPLSPQPDRDALAALGREASAEAHDFGNILAAITGNA